MDREPGQKIRHQSIRASLQSLWTEYLYGDGWRLVEIVLSLQIIYRGIAILFFDGMAASYYETFPMRENSLVWGAVCIAIGVLRICGTVINGKWKRSPRLRWACGVMAFSYQGLHCYFFAALNSGLAIIAIGYLFNTVLEGMAVVRSSIDVRRKRALQCPSG